MRIENITQNINVNLLHEELEGLYFPDFHGINLFPDGDLVVVLGTVESTGQLVERPYKEEELEKVMALLEDHDPTKKTKHEKKREERAMRAETLVAQLRQHPDPALRDLAEFLQ